MIISVIKGRLRYSYFEQILELVNTYFLYMTGTVVVSHRPTNHILIKIVLNFFIQMLNKLLLLISESYKFETDINTK